MLLFRLYPNIVLDYWNIENWIGAKANNFNYQVTDDLGHPAVPEPVDPPPTTAQVEMAARTRKCLIDMIESLSKPFWPRRPPASANPPSPYKQGGYHPKLDDTHRVDQQPLPPSPKIIRKKIPLPVFVTKKAGEDKKEVAGSPPATKTVRKPLTRPTLAKRAPKKDGKQLG